MRCDSVTISGKEKEKKVRKKGKEKSYARDVVSGLVPVGVTDRY